MPITACRETNATTVQGETVIDLGSGAGLDVFLAAKRVGPGGKVIGVDMNKEMLAKANALRESSGASNTEFVESPITNIALPDGVADCIISNCVINLVPEAEKPLVFHEMARLLKPSGRIAVSDILARKQLPHTIRNNVALYVSCVAGASLVGEYETWLTSAGFADLLISDAGGDLNVYLEAAADGTGMAGSKECESCCGKLERADAERVAGLAAELKDFDMNEWVGSFKIYAVKK